MSYFAVNNNGVWHNPGLIHVWFYTCLLKNKFQWITIIGMLSTFQIIFFYTDVIWNNNEVTVNQEGTQFNFN